MAYSPPIGSIYHLYTTYILPSGGLYATYHLLGEPEATIEMKGFFLVVKGSPFSAVRKMSLMSSLKVVTSKRVNE